MYEIKHSEDEIDRLLNETDEQRNRGGSRFPGMTYEDGLRDALEWVVGLSDDNPYPEA